MSTECASISRKKRKLSPALHERTNDLRPLRYQQNKDAINEHRRFVYHRRKTRFHIAYEFPHSHKYGSLANIMQRTFPITVSFLEYFPNHNVSPLIHLPDMNFFLSQPFPFPEDHLHENNLTNNNFHPSSTANVCF